MKNQTKTSSFSSCAEEESRYDGFLPAEEEQKLSKNFFLLKMRDIIRLHKKGRQTAEKEKELKEFRRQDLPPK